MVAPGSYRLDPGGSAVRVELRGAGGRVGRPVACELLLVSGTLVVAVPVGDSAVAAEVDAGSIRTAGGHERADVLARAALDVAHHPVIAFRSGAFTDEGRGHLRVRGELVVKGRPLLVDGNARVRTAADGAVLVSFGFTLDRVGAGVLLPRWAEVLRLVAPVGRVVVSARFALT